IYRNLFQSGGVINTMKNYNEDKNYVNYSWVLLIGKFFVYLLFLPLYLFNKILNSITNDSDYIPYR
ncbi:MAG: hypothetical protein ACE5GL_02375, partial [Calditrichia bacterium]